MHWLGTPVGSVLSEGRLRPIIIGVAGGTASGKTTVSEAILERVGRERIAYIQHDSYYRDLGHLPLEERARLNFDHPDALETELLVDTCGGCRRASRWRCPSTTLPPIPHRSHTAH